MSLSSSSEAAGSAILVVRGETNLEWEGLSVDLGVSCVSPAGGPFLSMGGLSIVCEMAWWICISRVVSFWRRTLGKFFACGIANTPSTFWENAPTIIYKGQIRFFWTFGKNPKNSSLRSMKSALFLNFLTQVLYGFVRKTWKNVKTQGSILQIW